MILNQRREQMYTKGLGQTVSTIHSQDCSLLCVEITWCLLFTHICTSSLNYHIHVSYQSSIFPPSHTPLPTCNSRIYFCLISVFVFVSSPTFKPSVHECFLSRFSGLVLPQLSSALFRLFCGFFVTENAVIDVTVWEMVTNIAPLYTFQIKKNYPNTCSQSWNIQRITCCFFEWLQKSRNS